MPKLPTARSADGDTIDVKPYPPTSPKKSGAKQPKKQASPSDDTTNDVKPSGSASPKKAAGKQAAKKWSKQDKIDILLKVVQTASPDWQVSRKPPFKPVLSLTGKHTNALQAMAEGFDEGRTKSQVHDQWR
jgi:hypothetical protein